MVYCSNCKYFIGYHNYNNRDYTCKFGKTIEKNAFEKRQKLTNGKVKNKNNDCPDYQRKWWKFWVKESFDSNQLREIK